MILTHKFIILDVGLVLFRLFIHFEYLLSTHRRHHSDHLDLLFDERPVLPSSVSLYLLFVLLGEQFFKKPFLHLSFVLVIILNLLLTLSFLFLSLAGHTLFEPVSELLFLFFLFPYRLYLLSLFFDLSLFFKPSINNRFTFFIFLLDFLLRGLGLNLRGAVVQIIVFILHGLGM